MHKDANDRTCIGNPPWDFASREDADHSTPYLIAATLRDGTVTLESFDDAHIFDKGLRAVMAKIEVVENDEFTASYKRIPQEHRTRVTVEMNSGERLIGNAGGDADDLSAPKSQTQIEDKFRSLTDQVLGKKQAEDVLVALGTLENVDDVATLLAKFVVI